MFKSIRWKFILVYFLLVFIAMVIVGVFIVGKFETQQLDYREDAMTKQIESIISTSSYLSKPNWDNYEDKIQDTINDWRLDVTETVYIISGSKPPRIIASSSRDYQSIIGKNAYINKAINPDLVMEAYNGQKATFDVENPNDDSVSRHIAYPVIDDVGRVKGVVYMTSNLENIYETLDGARNILTNATFLALLITVVLGFFIASSITEPIRDVTEKAEKMAKGDFDQFVSVKSDDEIGQLAHMFNYLTLKLKSTIREIDLERAKLDTIFKYMADGVVAIDKNNRMIHANPIALKILNIENETVDLKERKDISKDILNLDGLDYTDMESLEMDETIYIDSNIYRLRYAPFRNEKDSIAGVIIVFQDITEQQKLDNMRREFVANVSHELKTPITTIKSYTETLMDYDDIDPDTSNRFLTVIDNECDRMNRIVKDLLQLSNMDYDKTVWDKLEFSIDKLIEDTLVKLKLAFEEKHQNIKVDIAEELPLVYADKDGIQQVLLNIISNAIKYTEENGNIYISSFVKDNNLMINIKDDGIGIPEADQLRIFERFYRVDKGRARQSGGSGLGLSIAKQIIEGQGGDLVLKSEYEKGTEVDIIIPMV